MRQRDEERLIAGLRAVSENAREFEEICRLSSAKDSFEGLVNAYVEIEDIMSPAWPLPVTGTLKDRMVEAAFSKAETCRDALQKYLARLGSIRQRIAGGADECRTVRDCVALDLGVQQAYGSAALGTLSINALVELAQEVETLCSRELLFKASLIEASSAPEAPGSSSAEARANLAYWVGRPYLEPTRLATISAMFEAEQQCMRAAASP